MASAVVVTDDPVVEWSRSAFALARLAIHAGCAFFAGDGGLASCFEVKALSIQLDLLGLHLFEGLDGAEAVDISPFVVYIEATDPCLTCVDLTSVLLSVKSMFERGRTKESVVMVSAGRSSFGILCEPCNPPWPDRIDSARPRAEGCALERLLMLSERFSIALCTNPPISFVGEGDRFEPLLSCDCTKPIVDVLLRLVFTLASLIVDVVREPR